MQIQMTICITKARERPKRYTLEFTLLIIFFLKKKGLNGHHAAESNSFA